MAVNYPRTTEIVGNMEAASQANDINTLYDLKKDYQRAIVTEIVGHGREVATSVEHSKELMGLERRKNKAIEPHTSGLLKMMVMDVKTVLKERLEEDIVD